MYDPFSKSLVQHFFVPLLKPLGFGNLLVRRVTVKDVVVSFTGRACPNVTGDISKGLQCSDYNIFKKKKSIVPTLRQTIDSPKLSDILQVAY